MLQKLLKVLTLKAKFRVIVAFTLIGLFITITGFVYLNAIDDLKTDIREALISTHSLDTFLLEIGHNINHLKISKDVGKDKKINIDIIQPLVDSLSDIQFKANDLEDQFAKIKGSALALLLLPYSVIGETSSKIEEVTSSIREMEKLRWKHLEDDLNISLFLLSLEGNLTQLEAIAVKDLESFLGLLIARLEIVLHNFNIVLFTSIILIGALTVVSIIVLLSYVRNNILRFIKILDELNKAEGDLTVSVPEDSLDTLGMLGKGFNTFVHRIKGLISSLKSEIARVQDSSHSILQIATVSSANVNSILKETEDIEKNTEAQTNNVLQTISSIKEIVDLMKVVADNVDEQRTVISTTSYTAKYMVKQFQNLADKSKKVYEAASQLLRLAKNGGNAVTKTVQSINEIQEDSVKINEIVSVISSIAEQTNLLAMNAAIEAAHAKEYGKGFAVVADEVRKLAEHSSDASGEIVELIKSTVDKVHVSVGLSDNSYKALQNILEETASTTSFINDISTGISETREETDEILEFIAELNLSSERVRESTELGREKAENIIDAVNQVQEYADNITKSLQGQLVSSKTIVKNVDNLSDYSRINDKVVMKLKELSDLFKTDEAVEIDAYDRAFLLGGNGELDPDRPIT